MTFLELCKKVRQECGVQGAGTPAAVTSQVGMSKRIVEWVQDADTIIQDKHTDWDFLWKEFSEDTILNSDSVSKPDDFGQWDRTTFAVNRGTATGRGLNLVEYKDWRVNNSLKTISEPFSVTILPSNDLALGAPANGVYSIYGVYWKAPVLLTTDAQEPPYPARFQRAIVARAKMFFFEDQEAWENYQAAEKEYLLKLSELETFAAPGQHFRGQAESDIPAARAE
jgi:hypothetical protein